MRYSLTFAASAVWSIAAAQSSNSTSAQWIAPSLPLGPIAIDSVTTASADTAPMTPNVGLAANVLNPVVGNEAQPVVEAPPAAATPPPTSISNNAASVAPPAGIAQQPASNSLPIPSGAAPFAGPQYVPYPYPYPYQFAQPAAGQAPNGIGPQGGYPQYVPQYVLPPGYQLQPIPQQPAPKGAAPTLGSTYQPPLIAGGVPAGYIQPQYAILPNGQIVPLQVAPGQQYPAAAPYSPYYPQYVPFAYSPQQAVPPVAGSSPASSPAVVPAAVSASGPSVAATPFQLPSPAPVASPATSQILVSPPIGSSNAQSTSSASATATARSSAAPQPKAAPTLAPIPAIAPSPSPPKVSSQPKPSSAAPIVANAPGTKPAASSGMIISITVPIPYEPTNHMTVTTPTAVASSSSVPVAPIQEPEPAAPAPADDESQGPPPMLISPQEIAANPNKPYPVKSTYSAPPLDAPTSMPYMQSALGGSALKPTSRPTPKPVSSSRPAQPKANTPQYAAPRPITSKPYVPRPVAKPTPVLPPLEGYQPAAGYSEQTGLIPIPAATPFPVVSAGTDSSNLPCGMLNPCGAADAPMPMYDNSANGSSSQESNPALIPGDSLASGSNADSTSVPYNPGYPRPGESASSSNTPPSSNPLSLLNPLNPLNPFNPMNPLNPLSYPLSYLSSKSYPAPTQRPGPTRPRPTNQTRPRPAILPPPRIVPEEDVMPTCGGQGPCSRGELCYDKVGQNVVLAGQSAAVGVCFSGTCGLSGCSDGQVCIEGHCAIREFGCGPGYGDCPDGTGWRCAGRGLTTLFTGYCIFDPVGAQAPQTGFGALVSGINNAINSIQDGDDALTPPFRQVSELYGSSQYMQDSAREDQDDDSTEIDLDD